MVRKEPWPRPHGRMEKTRIICYLGPGRAEYAFSVHLMMLVCILLFSFFNHDFVALSAYQIFLLSLTLHKKKAFSNSRAGQLPDTLFTVIS